MDFQLILLAILAAYLVYDIVQAMTRPMLRNVLRMLCVPVAFIITFVLQALGVFQGFIEWAVDKGLALAGGLPEQLSMLSGAISFLTALSKFSQRLYPNNFIKSLAYQNSIFSSSVF